MMTSQRSNTAVHTASLTPGLRVEERVLLDEIIALIHARVGALKTPRTGELLAYQLETGGKRLRPLLVVRTAIALGEEPRRALPFAACCELVHQATLVHDDLQDQDRYRRGAPTVWYKYGANRAIDLGDAMLYHALLLLSELEGAERGRLQSLVIESVLQIVEGQELEFALSRAACPTIEQYFASITGKTAALLMLPLVGAAQLYARDDALVEALRRASRHLGLAYQLRNDLFNVFTKEGHDRRGSDIAEGKRSALVVYTAAAVDEARQRRMLEILDQPRARTTPEQVRFVQRLFVESGARAWVARTLLMHTEAATREPELARYPALSRVLRGFSSLVARDVAELASAGTASEQAPFDAGLMARSCASSSTMHVMALASEGGAW